MRYNAHSSRSGVIGIINSGLYVLNRNTMAVKSQGILYKKFWVYATSVVEDVMPVICDDCY